ncbi:MAG: hypothetical protein ACYC8S_00135 [Minisyncoccota bacterium]
MERNFGESLPQNKKEEGGTIDGAVEKFRKLLAVPAVFAFFTASAEALPASQIEQAIQSGNKIEYVDSGSLNEIKQGLVELKKTGKTSFWVHENIKGLYEMVYLVGENTIVINAWTDKKTEDEAPAPERSYTFGNGAVEVKSGFILDSSQPYAGIETLIQNHDGKDILTYTKGREEYRVGDQDTAFAGEVAGTINAGLAYDATVVKLVEEENRPTSWAHPDGH